MRIRLMCLPHQGASNDVQYDLFGSTWIMTRPWSEVKFWSWPFNVILYIFRRALTRETRWYKINSLPLPYQKLFSKSHFRKIPSFWHWLPLESKSMTSPQICWQNVTWVLPGLSYDFCWSVLSWFRYVNDCLSKYAKLGKMWRLVTSGDLNFGLGKIWPELFPKNFVRAIEHFFFRFSLQCLKPPLPHDSEPLGARQE